MKNKVKKLAIITLNITLIFVSVLSKQIVHAEDELPVIFVDKNLEFAVKQQLHIDELTPILPEDMKALSSLDVHNLNILNLEGLEYAVNLEILDASWNFIEDYDVLKGLDLVQLDLSFNKIKDFHYIEGIETLNLQYNDIVDIIKLSEINDHDEVSINLNENMIDFSDASNVMIVDAFDGTTVELLYDHQYRVETRPPFRPFILAVETTIVDVDEGILDVEIKGMLPRLENTFASDYYYTYNGVSSKVVASENGEFTIELQGTSDDTFYLRVKDPNYEIYFTTHFDLVGNLINPISKVEISPHEPSMDLGDLLQLNAILEPENASIQDVFWFSSHPELASITQEGVVVAHHYGDVELEVVTVDGGFKAKTMISIADPIAEFYFEQEEVMINVGDSHTLDLKVVPSDIPFDDFEWNSSNESVVHVDAHGVITGLSKGKATISVKTQNNNHSDTVEIIVRQPVENIIVSHDTVSLLSGQYFKLIASILPLNADNQNVVWSSSAPDVVSVNQVGNVRALQGGEAIITVTSQEGGFSAHTHVVVTQLVTDIILDTNHLQLLEGERTQLVAQIEPYHATNQTLLWSSSDNTVVTVDASGNVDALKQGKARITIASEDGGTSTYVDVTVRLFDLNIVEILNAKLDKGYLSGIEINRSVSSIITLIKKEDSAADVKIFDQVNQLKKTNDLLATGDRLEVNLSNGETFEYILAIKGDVNGDGKITAADYILIANHLLSKKELIKQEVVAADINGDQKLTAADYVQLANHLLGKKKIYE